MKSGLIKGRAVVVDRDHFATVGGEMRRPLSDYLLDLGRGGLSLLKGMGLTMGYFIRPSRIITQQYPENRETLQMFPRFRGRLAMGRGDDGDTLCTACGICEKSCPNGTISVLSGRNQERQKVLGRYIYRFQQCTLCGLCVESCPFGALYMAGEFECSVYDRGKLETILYQAEFAAEEPPAPTNAEEDRQPAALTETARKTPGEKV